VKFHEWLTPTGGETEAAKKHRASLESCLKSNFGMIGFFRSGSFGNGTSIRSYSDVDYFAAIPNDNLSSDSSKALREISGVLSQRFPSTNVAVRCPAVTVPFGTDASEKTEIVPAVPAEVLKKNGNEYIIFKIPDCGGSWMKSGPEAHNHYVASINDKLNRKVKPLIRFLKAWKYSQNVPISSFYLEMRLASYASTQSQIVYSIDLKTILNQLWVDQLAAMQDPIGISGYIKPCNTEAQKKESLSKLATASVRADKAREAEENGDIANAYYWWNLLFNGEFPAY